MPIYAYRCTKCGEDLEVKQSMTDDPLKKCPKCKKMGLRKVYAPVGIVLKGSGFHKTDYASSRRKSDEKKSEAADKKSESSDKKSESKSSSSDKASSSSE